MPLVTRKQVVISLPIGLSQWLTEQAEREKRPKSRVVERLLEQYQEHLEHDEKNIFKKL